MAFTERAPAKINLGLHVLRKRPDGYHEVETVLHRLDWADTITAEPADSLSMTCSDPTLPTDERNLCMKAARGLADAAGVDAGAALHLEKRVPYGAGLGSGSSDAAATLRLLRNMWNVDATRDELSGIGGRIGADVPFFLQDSPAAYATGRGDVLSPLSADGNPYRLPYPVLVVVPPVQVSTRAAYDDVTPGELDRADIRTLVRSNELKRWRTQLTNDFEEPIITSEPSVATLRRALADTEAEYVSLSGSGAAVYGVFASQGAAQAAKDRFDSSDLRTHLMPAPG